MLKFILALLIFCAPLAAYEDGCFFLVYNQRIGKYSAFWVDNSQMNKILKKSMPLEYDVARYFFSESLKEKNYVKSEGHFYDIFLEEETPTTNTEK